MFLITGLIILTAGIFMVRKGRTGTRDLARYENENRLEDGSIYFKDIESQRTHGANKNLSTVISAMGFFTAVFGLILIGYGLGIFTHTI